MRSLWCAAGSGPCSCNLYVPLKCRRYRKEFRLLCEGVGVEIARCEWMRRIAMAEIDAAENGGRFPDQRFWIRNQSQHEFQYLDEPHERQFTVGARVEELRARVVAVDDRDLRRTASRTLGTSLGLLSALLREAALSSLATPVAPLLWRVDGFVGGGGRDGEEALRRRFIDILDAADRSLDVVLGEAERRAAAKRRAAAAALLKHVEVDA